MYNIMFDLRQSQNDRLEDAGVIKYGERVNSIPKAGRTTLRSRINNGIREVIRGGAR